MFNQKIFVLGYEEFVLLMGLLGIEGKIIENTEQFSKEFDRLIKDSSIGMIIVALNLPENEIEYLFDFKLNNKKPFVFYVPDVFTTDIEQQNKIMAKIFKFINQII
ncbi:MAG: V-type ATP synthase subunit F [Candidatus Hodarchaeota archaeon]